jgi:hypothetical protein
MMNPDFDPLALLEHLQLQNLEHAENMVAVSQFIQQLTESVNTQRRQLDTMYNMFVSLNNINQVLESRIAALEQQENKDINKQATLQA